MKLSVLQSNLNKALAVTSRIIQTNNSLPVLGNILLLTKDGRLELQATNLELAISYKIGAKIEKTGSLSVPARLISDLIHSLPNDKIQLVQVKDNLEIHTSQLNSVINGIAASEFPKIPDVKTTQQFSINTDEFISALEYVLAAVSVDESRPVLTGVYCKVSNSVLTCAATDSYRLAQYSISDVKIDDLEIIIPYRTIQELIRTIKTEAVKEIEVGVTKTEVVFSTKNFTLTSQLINGSYPYYTKIIPKSSTTNITVNKDDLLSSLKIASLFSRENAHTITLSNTKDTLTVQSQSAQVGVNESKIPVKSSGENQEINLNARYLIDALSVISEKSITISLKDKLDPCVISASNKKSADNFHIIMPLRS